MFVRGLAKSILLMSLGLTACSKPPIEQPVTSSKSLETQFDKVLEGSIDNRLRIQMRLRRDGEDLKGRYFYEKTREKSGLLVPILLQGKIASDGTFKLDEFDGDGKQTGAFQGKISYKPGGSEPALQMSGTWTKPDGKKQLAFSALEPRIDLGPGFRLTEDTKQEKNS